MKPVTLLLLFGSLLIVGCSVDSPPLPEQIFGDFPPCSSDLSRAGPKNVEEAASMLLACAPVSERIAIQSLSEREFRSRSQYENRLFYRSEWLIASESELRKSLVILGFQYPSDMSVAILSAVWHRMHREPFDIKGLADCSRAWNSEMHRLSQSVPPGTQIPGVGFSCEDTERVEAGRHLWPDQ